MSDDGDTGGSGGFLWGLVLGLILGAAGGAILASRPGRAQLESLRDRTIELTSEARRAAGDSDSPVRRAIQEGVTAARQRRAELEKTVSEGVDA